MKKTIYIITGVLIVLGLFLYTMYPKLSYSFSEEQKVYEKHSILINNITEKLIEEGKAVIELKNIRDDLKQLDTKRRETETKITGMGKTVNNIKQIEPDSKEGQELLEKMDVEFNEKVFQAVKKEHPEITKEEYLELLKDE